MSEWMPIETAPKDEWVIVWNGSAVKAGVWVEADEYDDYESSWCFGSEYWGGTLYDGANVMSPQPTHWMPLPEPPK